VAVVGASPPETVVEVGSTRIVVGSHDSEFVVLPSCGMLVTPLGLASVGVGVGSGAVVFEVLLVTGGGGGTLVNDDGGGVVIGGSLVFDPGGGVELGGGGGSVVLETGGGGSMMVDDTGGGVGSVGLSVGTVSLGFGSGSVVAEVTIPVPGGVVSGIVMSDEVGRGSSGIFVSVAFWSGGATLVITETTSLIMDLTGSRGFFSVGSAVVVGVGVGVVDSLTTPVGAITIPVLELVVVGARETGGADESSSEVGGFEIGSWVGGFETGFWGASDGFTLGCTLKGVSEVSVGSGFVLLPPMPLFLFGVGIGAGGTKTVLWITTVVTAAATLGNGRSVKLSISSDKLDCLFVVAAVDDVSSALGAGLSSEVMVALVNCRLTCRGKYILLLSVVSWPATDTAATKAATKAEVVRILYLIVTRHALARVVFR
jgi:hypothetical protein